MSNLTIDAVGLILRLSDRLARLEAKPEHEAERIALVADLRNLAARPGLEDAGQQAPAPHRLCPGCETTNPDDLRYVEEIACGRRVLGRDPATGVYVAEDDYELDGYEDYHSNGRIVCEACGAWFSVPDALPGAPPLVRKSGDPEWKGGV